MISFDLQDKLFTSLAANKELLRLLDADIADIELLNQKIIRGIPNADLLEGNVPCLTINFINARPTYNHLVNHGILEVVIFAQFAGLIAEIYKTIMPIIHDLDDSFQVIHEGQLSSGITGIQAYAIRFSPLINS